MRDGIWSSLPLEHWRDTSTTLHLWTQIVGKVRVRQCPLVAQPVSTFHANVMRVLARGKQLRLLARRRP